MPRPLRIHVHGGFYHATLRGNHRQDIFSHDGERTLLKVIVARAMEKHGAKVHAYCWMSNHIHLLVQVGDEPLGHPMQRIASEYARAFQLKRDTTGHLFENRYFATMVDTDAYLLEVLRYVHQNPVRARMFAHPGQYRWSSHAAYAGSNGESWVTTDFALALFSPDRARAAIRYRAFVSESPAAEMAAQLAKIDEGTPLLGRPAFMAEHAPTDKTSTALRDIIEQACVLHGVTVAELRSSSRTTRLVAARSFIAASATRGRGITLSAVARALNRDQATLRTARRRRATVTCDGDVQLALVSTEVEK